MINLYREENNKVVKAHEDHIDTNTMLSSSDFPDRRVKSESGLGGDYRKFVVTMIVYQVGHALKCPVSSPVTIIVY